MNAADSDDKAGPGAAAGITTLWRPVGLLEMALVFESGMRGFPPRRSEQPFFYSVLNRSYAEQIARQWNAREAPFAGYVIRLDIPGDYAAGFDAKTVGSSTHQEYWVPADRLSVRLWTRNRGE